MKSPRVGNMSMSLRSAESHFRASRTAPAVFAEIYEMKVSRQANRVREFTVVSCLGKRGACSQVNGSKG